MTGYRRNRVPGGTYFFTVNLAAHRTDILVRHIDDLRFAARKAPARAHVHIADWAGGRPDLTEAGERFAG